MQSKIKESFFRRILKLLGMEAFVFKKVFIVPGRNSYDLAERIAKKSGFPLAKVKWTTFDDKECKLQYEDNIRGAYLYVVNSTNAPASNMYDTELLIDAAKRASAERIIAVIPYFGGQRQERKDRGRVPITAMLNVKKLVSAGVYKIIAMDLHADAIQAFFERFDNLYASAIFVPYIKSLNLRDFYLMSLDTGGAKRIERYADYLNKLFGICFKQRAEEPDNIKVMKLLGDVSDKDVLMIDDLIDTAGSVEKFINLVFAAGAKNITCMFTHPMLSGKAYERIKSFPQVTFIVTDTLPIDQKFIDLPNFKVLSTDTLFAEVIRRDANNESISSLFVF